jgi:hypothetical protein
MTLRTTVLPLGFGLSAILCVPAGGSDDDPAPAARRPVRVYTNEDLDRVHPFRDETGVRSVPAVGPDRSPASPPPRDRRRARGEDYWRREAARVRDRVQSLEAQAAEVRALIAERAEEASHLLTNRRRYASGSRTEPALRAKLAALERRMRQMEDDLAERARREGALPGWLR